jgi:hypothetical protein
MSPVPPGGQPYAELYFGNRAEAAEERQAAWITNRRPASVQGRPDVGLSATNVAATFGPVMERVIEPCEAPDYKWFDLDKGTAISSSSLPQDVVDSTFEDWMRQTGVDVTAPAGSSPSLISRGGEFIALPVQTSLWDSASAQEIERLIAEARPERKTAVMRSDGELPATFVFRTREGGMGILQITGLTENPRGVKIRYKLVRNPPTIFQFGAEQECVLPELTLSGTNLYFNLRSHRWIACSRRDFGSHTYYEWLWENGADISADLRIAGSTNPPQAVGCFMAIVIPGPEVWKNALAWEDSSADSILTNSELAAAKCDSEYYLGNDRTVYYFRTRQGVLGMLQALGPENNPRGVKIRYKLVQKGQPANTASLSADTTGTDAALPAIQAWLALTDNEQYAESWRQASEGFRALETQDDWVGKGENIRKPLGKLLSRKLEKTEPNGQIFVAKFESSFEGLKAASETVTFARETDGRWRAAGYLILPRSNTNNAAVEPAQTWLRDIDNGNYAQSWTNAAQSFHSAISSEKWVEAVQQARQPLGSLVSRKTISAEEMSSLPGVPDGRYIVMQFETSFANKKSAVETVTFLLEKDGQWRAAGYYIK